jgi:hypothetical protein
MAELVQESEKLKSRKRAEHIFVQNSEEELGRLLEWLDENEVAKRAQAAATISPARPASG